MNKQKIIFIVFLISFFFISCNQREIDSKSLTIQVKELKKEIHNSYKPGFGIMMANIQSHHNKLWFAGQNKNWLLADFEVHEIIERFEELERHQSNKKEVSLIPMIKPVLEGLDEAIDNKDFKKFEQSYKSLTTTCNSCHITTKNNFIEIKTPERNNYENQKF